MFQVRYESMRRLSQAPPAIAGPIIAAPIVLDPTNTVNYNDVSVYYSGVVVSVPS